MGRQTTGGAFTDRWAFVPLQYHRQIVMLLPIHEVAGVVTLVPVSIALAKAKRAGAHPRTGMVFAVAMMVVAVTGICMVLLGADVFLGGISLFSGYLAASGWRDIRRRGAWSATDRLLAVFIGISAVVMAGIGLARLGDDPTIGSTMLVFAGIAAGLTTFDVVRLSRPAPRFRGRAVAHLIKMQSACIAAVTAFLVINSDAGLVVWLGPTVVLMPVFSWWSYRVASGGWPQAAGDHHPALPEPGKPHGSVYLRRPCPTLRSPTRVCCYPPPISATWVA